MVSWWLLGIQIPGKKIAMIYTDLNYLTDHSVSMPPVECKVTKDASFKFLDKLYK